MRKHKHQKTYRGESGIASIFIVLILMTVVGLISVGFSRLMNRELRQAVDRQLSAEAYYAAESGVNDAREYLSANAGNNFTGCTDWPASGNSYFVDSGNISEDKVSRYSCVTVNTQPTELDYSIPAGETRVFKLGGTSLADISKLYIGWENHRDSSASQPQPLGTMTSGQGQLPQDGSVPAGGTGVLQVGVYPNMDGSSKCSGTSAILTSSSTDSTNLALECASHSYFLYPNSPSGKPNTVDYQDNNTNGKTIPGNCSLPATPPPTSLTNATSRYCNSVITNLYNISPSSDDNHASAYYLRITAFYKTIDISIQATNNDSPTPKSLPIADVQGIIDVTGVGSDVLKRIQSRIPLQNTYPTAYGIQSMQSICKLFRQPVEDPGQYGGAEQDSSMGTYGTDGACTMPSGSNRIVNEGLPGVDITPPQINFWADKYDLSVGEGTTMHWRTTNAVSCDASGSWSGSPTVNGDAGTGPLNGIGSYTYTITCVNSSNISDQRSITITVNNNPPPCSTTAGGYDAGGGMWYLTGGGSGCEYYRDSVVGWNGGFGAFGPVPTDATCHYQYGGADPWGLYAESHWSAPGVPC
jgi:hypothetical protein